MLTGVVYLYRYLRVVLLSYIISSTEELSRLSVINSFQYSIRTYTMACGDDDYDCPTQALWTFPAPGDESLMPDKYPQRSSFKVEQYLETSAHHPPTSGFGATPLYVKDVVELTWPADFEVPFALYRNLYCKPCQQRVEDHNREEEFDWESCCKWISPRGLRCPTRCLVFGIT